MKAASIACSLAWTSVLSLFIAGCGNPAAPTNGAPRTLFVAPSGGNQNAGTRDAPWLTIRYAVGQLVAGDTLYLRGGTYTGPDNTVDSELGTVRSGLSWSQPITIAGYASETATIRPPANSHGIRLTRSAPQYLIVKDLVIDMAGQGGDPVVAPNGVYLSSGANHNRFQNLEIKNSINFGLVFSRANANSPSNEVLNCRIHDNGLPGGPATNGHGIYISTSDNLIEGNEIYDNQGYGLHLFDNAGPLDVSNNIVRNNTIRNNGRHGGTAYGIVVAWGDGNQVYGNVVDGNPGGILVYSNSANALVRDNTVSNNRPLAGIEIQFAQGTIVQDNVMFGNAVDIDDRGSGTVLSNNHGP